MFNRETIITTLKLNLTQYEHSPINIGEFRSISNSGIIPTFLVPPDGPWLAGPCFCDHIGIMEPSMARPKTQKIPNLTKFDIDMDKLILVG